MNALDPNDYVLSEKHKPEPAIEEDVGWILLPKVKGKKGRKPMQYAIKASTDQWMLGLQRVSGPKSKTPGVKSYRVEGYYGRLKHLLNDLMELVPLQDQPVELKDILQSVQETSKMCKSVFARLEVQDRELREGV